MRYALLMALSLAPVTAAEPPPAPTVTAAKSPEAVKPVEVVAVGRSVRLAAEASCQWVTFAAGVELHPAADGKSCVVVPPGDGRWQVMAYSAKGDLPSAPTVVDVVVGKSPTPPAPMPPQPAPPGPPAPVPPAPPAPVPPAPAPPADPFLTKLREAFVADAATPIEKRGQRLLLAELYRQTAELAAKPEIATGAMLLEQARKAADALHVSGLLGVRNLVAVELGAVADLTTPITPDIRGRLAGVYTRAATALSTLE